MIQYFRKIAYFVIPQKQHFKKQSRYNFFDSLLCTWFSFPFLMITRLSSPRGGEKIVPANLSIASSPHQGETQGGTILDESRRSFARSHSSSFATFPTNPFVSPLPWPRRKVKADRGRVHCDDYRGINRGETLGNPVGRFEGVGRITVTSRRCGWWISTSKPHARAAAAVWRGWLRGGGRKDSYIHAGAHKPVFSPYTETRCTKPGLKHRHRMSRSYERDEDGAWTWHTLPAQPSPSPPLPSPHPYPHPESHHPFGGWPSEARERLTENATD